MKTRRTELLDVALSWARAARRNRLDGRPFAALKCLAWAADYRRLALLHTERD